MPKSLNLYLIARRNNRYTLFGPLDAVEAIEKESANRIARFIGWVRTHRNRVVAWFGRVLEKGHEYYLKLEDRIDPAERVLKAMASVEHFVVHHGLSQPSADAQSRYRQVLRRQRYKHVFWFAVDLLISAVALFFTPILAPIPGPNVFLYFPLLRMLSHLRGIRGTSRGLRSAAAEFKCLPDLVGLEENLRAPQSDRRRILAMAGGLNICGLEKFLERMV